MPNTLSAFNPTMMAGSIQKILDQAHVGRSVCSFGLEKVLTAGSTVQRPYVSNLVANDYVDATGATNQDAIATDETLVVNKEKEVQFYVSRKDMVQNKFSTAEIWTGRAAFALRKVVDTDILAEVASAASEVNAGSLAGGSGTGNLTLTTANIIEVFSVAYQKLQEKNVEDEGDFVAVISPAHFSILQQKATGVGFNTADQVLKNGKVGHWMNFDIVISNNLPANRALFCKRGCIDMVMQAEPLVDKQTVPGKSGRQFLTTQLYGIKTFNTGKDEMVRVKIA